MNNMNWDGLRYFLAAAETGSLSAAAILLESNQPTVGRHIDALEKSLSIKLFQRSVKGLSLTQEGLSIYEQSQQLQSGVVKIQRTLISEKGEVKGNVRLSIPEGIAHEIIMPSLTQLYTKHPELKLTVNVSANTANLTRGEADIAIRLFRPEESYLVIKKLGTLTMGLFASKQYEKNYGIPTKLKELQQHKIITYSDSLSKLPENQWLLEHSTLSNCILNSDSTLSRMKATISGVGISIQPKIFSQSNPELIPLLKNIKLPSHEVWLVYHKDLRHLFRIRAVIDFLSTQLKHALIT